MTQELLIGIVSISIAAFLIFIALPDKDRVSPRFLQFEASLVLYPPVVMVFFAVGVAELLVWYLRTPH